MSWATNEFQISALSEKEMMNGAEGISDIEGKATRAGASERGQRMSFNGAEGISDIKVKRRG